MWFVILVIINIILPCCLGQESVDGNGNHWMDFWVVRLLLNLIGYATIFVPGFLLLRYLRSIRYNETAGLPSDDNDLTDSKNKKLLWEIGKSYTPTCLSQLVKQCVFGNDDHVSLEQLEEGSSTGTSESNPSVSKIFTLLFCIAGLQGAYLTWGVLQERIMTFEYGKTEDQPGEFFRNSQFLVFINRILAFMIGMSIIFVRRQPHHTTPLYKYSFSSFSNIMSSWCQYEALKFISFPTQVLAKASKVIPVMLMGKIVSRRTYEYHEYITACMISIGVALFLLNSGDVTRHKGTVTTISGVILLVGYMGFDSFTSNWQGELFKRYKVSSIQMMTGVNMFSCLLTGVSLLEQGGFFDSFAFMARNHLFVAHAVVLSVCSACGQLFIFYTISQFGPVTFTIIMTLRQAFAILLSCLIYGHPVKWLGLSGIVIVFIALFLRIYVNYRRRSQQSSVVTNTSTSRV